MQLADLRDHRNSRSGAVLVAVYAWLHAVHFGISLLDSTYVRLLRDRFDAASLEPVFNEISDLLLLFFGLLVVLGGVATALSVGRGRVFGLILSSWLVPLAQIPLMLAFGALVESSGFGPALRLLFGLTGSGLAVSGALLYLGAGNRPD